MMKSSKNNTKDNHKASGEDVCILCENDKRTTKTVINNVTDFWNSTSHKQKLQLLSVDKNFVLKQIRSSNLYSPNLASNSDTTNGKSGLGFSKQMCMCPACKKRKIIFNAVVKVFEDYIDELEDRAFDGHQPVSRHTAPKSCQTSPDLIQNSTTTNASGLGSLNKLSSPKIEIFGDYLTIRNDKLTVHESYFADNGPNHFFDVIKKIAEIFPSNSTDTFKTKKGTIINNTKIGTTGPDNIHTLINLCTMNSELNIKKVMIKKAKKVLSATTTEVFATNGSDHVNININNLNINVNMNPNTPPTVSKTSLISSTTSLEEEDYTDGEEDEDDEDDNVSTTTSSSSASSSSSHHAHGSQPHMSTSIDELVKTNTTQESRLLFQIYLARLFSHNITVAYKDMIALEMQNRLLEELESEKKETKNQQNKKGKSATKKQQQKEPKVTKAAPKKAATSINAITTATTTLL
jgi:hypothetical protein